MKTKDYFEGMVMRLATDVKGINEASEPSQIKYAIEVYNEIISLTNEEIKIRKIKLDAALKMKNMAEDLKATLSRAVRCELNVIKGGKK